MIARILAFSVERRWLVALLTLLVAAFGAWSALKLPIDATPDITNNQVQINAVATALSPEDVERQVTFPLETALSGIPGLVSTRSLSRNGFAQITAVFSDATDLYFARAQVNERLGEARGSLPPGVEVHMGPVTTGLGEIFMWTLHMKEPDGRPETDGKPGWQSDGGFLTPEGERLASDLDRAAWLRALQDWVIRPQMRAVPGVAGVDSIGGYVRQYQVRPDPARLAGLGLSFSDIAAALAASNQNRGAGYVERGGEGYVVRSSGRLTSIDDIGAVVVTTRAGVPVRIRDVATVGAGQELRVGAASEDGREAVVGTALMLIGGNSRDVAAAAGDKLREIARLLPPGVVVEPVLDRTTLVDATIRTVAKNLTEGALLVIAVLFLMLGNIRAAVITALVIPLAMLMTMTGMVRAGVSANLMSLGALDFGLIVDGAVIITENALRRLGLRQHELGRGLGLEERLAVVRQSAEEMIRPTVYGQAIIILVYVPMLSFTGVEGRMFTPMALTVMMALASAFVLSLTFVPAMIAIVISGKVLEKDVAVVRWLKALYRPALGASMRRPALALVAGVLLAVAAGGMFLRLGQEFIPQLDEKNLAMHAMRIPSTSLSQSLAMQLSVERKISALPEVALVFSKTGTAEVASDPMPVNVSDTFIMLKPEAEWPDPELGKEALIAKIRAAAETAPGNNLEFTQPIQMRFNELLAGARGDLAVKVFGDDFARLAPAAEAVAAQLRAIPGAVDVKVEQVSGLPFLNIDVDRQEIGRLGLSLAAVQDVIGAAIGGQHVGQIFEGDRRFDIVIRLDDALRADLEALKNLPVALPAGPPAPAGASGASTGLRSVPLRQVARLSVEEGPNQISRENGKRRIVVTANVRGRDIASVVDDARLAIAANVALPSGAWLAWGGQFENLAAARQRLMIVTPACFLLIFILLFQALGSTRDALLVFSAVPFALTGGVIALWLRGMPFSVSAAVGFIALSGVAVLNGLVMISRIRQLAEEGAPMREAVWEGALTRFRPVVMTALVASLGFLPMALATGAGAEVQKPLATVVIGGLVSATLLTLLALPTLYALFGAAGRKAEAPATT